MIYVNDDMGMGDNGEEKEPGMEPMPETPETTEGENTESGEAM